MYIQFNKRVRKSIKKLCRIIGEVLEVDEVDFLLATDTNAYNGKLELCFSTPIDDTYAALNLDEIHRTLEDVLDGFIMNEEVEWMNRGKELSRKELIKVLDKKIFYRELGK